MFPLCTIWQSYCIILLCSEVYCAKPFMKKQVCPEFINVTIENNLSHKSGAKSTLYNLAITGSPLSSHILFVLDLFFPLGCTSIVRNMNSNIFFFFISYPFEKNLQSDLYLHKMCTFSEQHVLSRYFYQNLSSCQDLGNQLVMMKCSVIFGQ